MGDLRNKLERRETRHWKGLSGFQIAALIWAWVAVEENPQGAIFGNPHWFQTRAALERKGILTCQTRPRFLTEKGAKICAQLLRAFPAETAEARDEKRKTDG